MILLLDLDGTVIDSTDAIVESFVVTCQKHNFATPTHNQITKLIGYPLDIMFRELGVQEEEVWDFVTTYKEHYRVISKTKTTLLPNAKKAIQFASTFATLGVVTTKTAKYSVELLEHFGLMQHFVTLIGRENVQNPKPDAEPILKALAAIKPKKGESVYMIGDTTLDLKSAENAGVGAVALLCGYGLKSELEHFNFPICSNLLEAVELLQKEKKQHTLL